MDCGARDSLRARRAPWRRLACCFAVLGGVVNLAEGLPRACALAPARGGGARACRAAADSAAHAVIAAAVWATALAVESRRSPTRRRAAEVAAAGVAGSIMDVDHFLAAGSFRLDAALHLSRRPFGHALIAPVAALAIGRCRRPGVLCATAWLSHQLRDALRRGLWLWPLASTPALPWRGYLCAQCALAFAAGGGIARLAPEAAARLPR